MKKVTLIMAFVISAGVIMADTISKIDTSRVNIVSEKQSIDTITSAAKLILPSASADPQLPLYLCAFIGLLARAIWNTYKGIKSTTNGTSTAFDFQHWLTDNVLSKLTAVMAIIIGLQTIIKMPDTLIWQIIMCAIALVIGVFADYAADKMKWLTNKAKMLALANQIKAVTGDAKMVAAVINQISPTAAADINKAAVVVDQKIDEITK